MNKNKPLDYKLLRKTLNHKDLKFVTTKELKPLDQFLGQKRALAAVTFGLGIKSQGYNLYAMGPSGIGKHSLISLVLADVAAKKSTPSDWCYIHNFIFPEKPIAIQLPAGMGIQLRDDMNQFIKELSTSILAAYESEEYHLQLQNIHKEFTKQKKKKDKKNIKVSDKKIKIPHLYKERLEKEKELQKKYASVIIEPFIDNLKNKYAIFPEVIAHLSAIENDIIVRVNDLVKLDDNNFLYFNLESHILVNYQVNVLVNHANTHGAPVIFEENPSYTNLICRVEHITELGAQVTNFTLIRPGALHKANGGFLLIEARKIKKEKNAWEGLKRALYAKQIMVEPVEHLTELVRPVSLEPMPIPLHVKIILMGSRHDYYSLCHKDPDFNELFKVAVDFDEYIDRSPGNINLYARLIAAIIQREKLRPFHASAVALIIDHGTRLAEDIQKISTHIRSIDDLIIESDYWASINNKELVTAQHVKHAIDAKTHRMDRTRELYYEDIVRDFVLIHTSGNSIGQVNCLSVVRVGKFSYGHPTRVTAKVRVGKGKLIDIQHEIDLAGPIHSKAGLTLASFLASRYNPNNLFSLAASISFEQIYGMTDGDSASIAELCALLSAITEIPIKQSLAVTGSIDQYGIAQSIGGLNEKIEGFFDVCKLRGLRGDHGVIIPAVNMQNLMLREDILVAAKAKKFHVYSVKTVDEALELLCGCIAGKREKNGEFTKGSVNYLVEQRLIEYSQKVRRFRK